MCRGKKVFGVLDLHKDLVLKIDASLVNIGDLMLLSKH